MERLQIDANRPWERVIGYSRAVRVGPLIEVSATAAADQDGGILAKGDMLGQARECLRIIGEALAEMGASFEDVVRTRVFLKDVSRWEEAGCAHGEMFGDIRPATAFIGIDRFLEPDILVEIEATAFKQ
jgi:enamine deaminase RidA (YjgF/YER057c/UK114 family)